MLSERAVWYAALTELMRGPVAACALASVLFIWFGRSGHATPAYTQVLTIVVYSVVILTLRELVAAPINYMRESATSPTTLIQIFPMTNAASPVARVLGLIDLFLLWWLAVLARGLSVLYGERTSKIAATLYGVYFGVAALLAAAMALTGGTI
jgi:hypothetical protein